MDAIAKNRRDRDNLSWHWHTLHDRSAVQERTCAAAPGQREKIEWHQAAQNENGEMRDGIGEYLAKDEGERGHRDQGIQQRPEYAQRHVAIANFEVFLDEIA